MSTLIIVRKTILHISLLIFLSLNTGCQLLNQTTMITASYGQYYLWLKSLNQEELLQEIVQQKHNLTENNSDTELYLLLIHALPNSPIHNPYTAKALLNVFQLQYVSTRYNSENLAFITMLRDQLNEQLLILEKLSKVSKTNEENQIIQTSLHKENFKHQQELKRLSQQIIQLKKIEQTINNHGQ